MHSYRGGRSALILEFLVNNEIYIVHMQKRTAVLKILMHVKKSEDAYVNACENSTS